MLTFFLGTFILLTLETSAQTVNQDKQNKKEVNTAQKTPVKMIQSLLGEWKIDKILKGKTDVTEKLKARDQILSFNSEARYVVRSGKENIDSGSYRMNEQIGSLYLESESDEKSREWKTEFIDESMILTRKQGNSEKDNLQYFYTRLTPATAREN